MLLYLGAGWVVAEILLAVRERFALPESLDNVVLGIFIAGFVACALLLATVNASRTSPLASTSRVLAIAMTGSAIAIGVSAWLGQSEQATGIPSIAVLPCEYEGIEDHAFLGPAAAQELHAKLAKLSGLQIPSWRSVLNSVQVGEGSAQIAELLHVQNLTSCEIREDGDGIELSASILDPRTEELVWSGRQTYATADLVHALSNLSLAIADALSVRLTLDESDRLSRAPTSSPEAYEHYLRARQAQGGSHFGIRTVMNVLAIGEDEYELAMNHYRAAVELDPAFAEAWAGMATATRGYGSNVKGEDKFGAALKSYGEQAYEYAERALAHDPCNAEALLLKKDIRWLASSDQDESPQADMLSVQRAIECEPNNAEAWRQLANTYSNFAVNPWMGTEYPAKEMRTALMKALALDPTNCRIQEYYINTFRSPIWAPRPQDRLDLDETLQAIRSALMVNPDCGDMYRLLAEISAEQGRFDEAIAWEMRRHELASKNPNVGPCQIAQLLSHLGFVEEASAWNAKALEAGFGWCIETDLECFQSREAYFSEDCKAQRLEGAKEIMSSSWSTASPAIRVFKYRSAMYEAQTSDRPDFVRRWLNEGLQMLGTDDPVAIIGKNPKRLISARREGLELVPIFRDLGLNEAADRMLELCRRDPEDPEQIVFNMDLNLYIDARHRALAGKKAEAMELLTRAVEQHQTFGGGPFPDGWDLMFDRALDPLREDPVYGPKLEQLIDEYDAWLQPARDRAAEAIETGDWASLRTLVEAPPTPLARTK
jgi:tetratricopeptide (TPR) repeat protein